MSEQNIATSKRGLEEAFNRGNLSVIDEDTTEDFVGHDPILGDQDRESAKQGIAGYRQAFPDLHITIEDIFAAGDKVVMRWSGSGTFENEFMGLKPTHEEGDPVWGHHHRPLRGRQDRRVLDPVGHADLHAERRRDPRASRSFRRQLESQTEQRRSASARPAGGRSWAVARATPPRR